MIFMRYLYFGFVGICLAANRESDDSVYSVYSDHSDPFDLDTRLQTLNTENIKSKPSISDYFNYDPGFSNSDEEKDENEYLKEVSSPPQFTKPPPNSPQTPLRAPYADNKMSPIVNRVYSPQGSQSQYTQSQHAQSQYAQSQHAQSQHAQSQYTQFNQRQPTSQSLQSPQSPLSPQLPHQLSQLSQSPLITKARTLSQSQQQPPSNFHERSGSKDTLYRSNSQTKAFLNRRKVTTPTVRTPPAHYYSASTVGIICPLCHVEFGKVEILQTHLDVHK